MYTGEDYLALQSRLRELADEKFRSFNESLIPGTEGSLGVRVPQLRVIAKTIAGTEDWRGYLAVAQDGTLEERLLQGMVIGAARCEYTERLQRIAWFVPKINNWAVCDVFCASLKDTARHRAEMWEFLQPYLAATQAFSLRFACVMLLDYFVTPDYIGRTLECLGGVRHTDYYVKMAVAWALSVCFVKQRAETMRFLQAHPLEEETRHKTVRKICESRRVAQDDKQLLRQWDKSPDSTLLL